MASSTDTPTPPRVALLQRPRLVREALAAALAARGLSVELSADDAPTLLAALDPERLDVVLLDLDAVPREHGPQLIDDVLRAVPCARVVALSAQPDAEALRRCSEAGARALLGTHEVGLELLVEIVAGVLRGERYLPARLTASLHDLPRAPLRADGHAELATLTDREREVLALVGLGHDNLKIAAELSITERTAKAHVAALYRKLGFENRVQLALRARDLGVTPRDRRGA